MNEKKSLKLTGKSVSVPMEPIPAAQAPVGESGINLSVLVGLHREDKDTISGIINFGTRPRKVVVHRYLDGWQRALSIRVGSMSNEAELVEICRIEADEDLRAQFVKLMEQAAEQDAKTRRNLASTMVEAATEGGLL